MLLYIINTLEVGRRGLVCLHSSTQAYLVPALCMFGILSVFFLASPVVPQLGFQDKLVQDVKGGTLNRDLR
jgi:hypothetical protein